MKEALIINVLIIALLAIALLITHNPLTIFGVLLLREMPYGLLQNDDEKEEVLTDYEKRGAGFIQD